MPEKAALGKMKQLAGQFTKGLRGGAKFRQTLFHSQSSDEILENISTYFAQMNENPENGAEDDVKLLSSCEAVSV